MRNGSCHSKPARVRWEAPSPCGHLHLGVVIGSDQCCTGSAFLRERKLRAVENRKMFLKEKKKKEEETRANAVFFSFTCVQKSGEEQNAWHGLMIWMPARRLSRRNLTPWRGTESDRAPCQGRSVVAGSLAHDAAQ